MTSPFRFFDANVASVTELSPTFRRVTFRGDGLESFADNGYDQRIKLILAIAGAGLCELDRGPEWYAAWRATPEHRRNPIRTYTARTVRRERREVDVDFAVHGTGGPASRFALTAKAGDEVVLLGPNADFAGPHGGVEYRVDPRPRRVLLAGDETAVPAIAAILERLPAGTRGTALLEVRDAADALPLAAPSTVDVRYLSRDRAPHGSRLVPAVTGGGGAGGAEPAADGELVWDVAGDHDGPGDRLWLAGESTMVRALRRHLVGREGVHRRSVAFMGYWRLGIRGQG